MRTHVWCGLFVLLGAASARAEDTRTAREKALDAIRAAGGKVVIDESKAEKLAVRVDLNRPRVKHRVIEIVRKYPTIRILSLCETRISDEGLVRLHPMPDLRELYLTYSAITDGGGKAL